KLTLKPTDDIPLCSNASDIYEFKSDSIENDDKNDPNFEINDSQSEFEIDGLLNQKWIDPRLGANTKTRKMAVAGQIWKPMITNINGHNKIGNNDDTVFWRGFGDEGNVLLSEKVHVGGSCTIDFQNFPFDRQFCQVKFGSYRFPSEEVSILWDEAAVDILTKIRTNEFQLANISTHILMDIRPSGNFTTAVIQFVLRRSNSHYLICTGAPCIIMVLLAYISLWFDINKRTMRFNVNIFSFGVNLYFYYSSTCLTQPVPYLKALDIFVGLCTCFSIISLLETFILDFLCSAEENLFHLKKHACSKEYPKYVYWIEMGMKIAFPIFYTFFVSLYGAVYVN
ncbi:hypothetical protein NQ314_018221, partial [Rhamnusium bicolor]